LGWHAEWSGTSAEQTGMHYEWLGMLSNVTFVQFKRSLMAGEQKDREENLSVKVCEPTPLQQSSRNVDFNAFIMFSKM